VLDAADTWTNVVVVTAEDNEGIEVSDDDDASVTAYDVRFTWQVSLTKADQ
jgi:hypothetical protein